MSAEKKQLDLLNYWNLIEYLNPVAMPKEYKKLKEDALPWNLPPPITKPGQKPEKFKYTIYLSSFSAESLFQFVRKYFNISDQGKDYPQVNYLTAAIEVDNAGVFIPNSFQLSMLPFVLMQLEQKKKEASIWKEKFDKQMIVFTQKLERDILTEEIENKPLSFKTIEKINKAVDNHITWGNSNLVSICYLTEKTTGSTSKSSSTIINSHVLDDLKQIIGRGSKFNFKKPLKTYLSAGINQQQVEHVNINENIEKLKLALHPNQFPDGRWPSNYTLSLMQQFAVNQIVKQLEDPKQNPIYAVNGPPGTGKTTLLKDIIAANIVAKAKEQVKIVNPQKIYKKAESINVYNEDLLYFYPLKKQYEKLNDFSMVVVSSNNGAVENITKELPLKSEIKGFEDRLSYFTTFEEKHSEGENWGTIAAVLGKRDNITAFVNKAEIGENSLLVYLNNHRKTSLKDWEEQVVLFNKKLAEVQEEKNRISLLIPEVEHYYQLQKQYDDLVIEIRKMHKADIEVTLIQEKVDELNRVEASLDKLQEVIDTNLDNNLIDNTYWNNLGTKESQEKCPWYLKRLNQLQTDLFIESLKINECFLHTANGTEDRYITNNFTVFLDLVRNYSPIREIDKRNAEIWTGFLQIVPVVSTTFASIQNMFRKVKTDFIPWLFIDEAGQALPQLASGAVWRSKRVVAVGDPLQIEPVDTMPPELANLLAKNYQLTSEDLKGNNSVQNLADKVSPFGTIVKNKDEDIWIGTPLKVHRRCIEPMFSIANKISYNNAMVCATEPPTDFESELPTGFIDVKGNTKGRHFVQEQADVVFKLIFSAFSNHQTDPYAPYPDVFIISPFSEVAKAIKQQLKNELIKNLLLLDKKHIRKWVNKSVGTVHTFQGKQAETVIMCLGCDQKSMNAARWAAEKPNILNVALTRAKYRFIAVGDRDLWIKLPYYKELKDLKVFRD